MSERDAFLRAISEAWGDPTPILVFADWAEEHGTDDPALLRWYGGHVMSALAAVPPVCARAGGDDREARDRAGEALARHPQSHALLRCAAVAFCRRPGVWEAVGKEVIRPAVALCRRLALGFAPDSLRHIDQRLAQVAASAIAREHQAAYAAGEMAMAGGLGERMAAHRLVAELLAERPEAARAAVANHAAARVLPHHTAAEYRWQAAVYAALALVPRLD